MSGGSMNYLYSKLEYDANFDMDTPERRAFAKHLKLVAKALHDIEWVDSGDYGPGGDTEAIRACLSSGATLNETVQPADRGSELSAGLGAWVPVAERMPPPCSVVLVAYRNRLGHWRRIRAEWVPAKTQEADIENEFSDYDEATDMHWTPEGWYECINNWDDYSSVKVYEGEPSHWMHLPLPPESA